MGDFKCKGAIMGHASKQTGRKFGGKDCLMHTKKLKSDSGKSYQKIDWHSWTSKILDTRRSDPKHFGLRLYVKRNLTAATEFLP